MDFWMKCVWALAAGTIVACLIALGSTTGGFRGGAPAATPQPQYFTRPDPMRSVVEYGVNDGGRTTIYNTMLAR